MIHYRIPEKQRRYERPAPRELTPEQKRLARARQNEGVAGVLVGEYVGPRIDLIMFGRVVGV